MRRLTLLFIFLIGSAGAAWGQCSPAKPQACGSPGMNAPVMVAPGISDAATPTAHLGALTMNFPTHAALLAFQPTNVGTSMVTADVAGRFAPGDGGAATYSWSAASTATVEDPFVLQATGVTTGRWILNLPPNGLSVLVGFAKCDGVNDDSTAINFLFQNASVALTRFTAVIPPNVTCTFGPATTVTIPRRAELRGVGNAPDSTNGGNFISPIGAITLSPTKTISVGGVMRNLLIISTGLTAFPANMEEVLAAHAAWIASGSVAITASNDGVILEDLRVIGFNKAFLSAGRADLRMKNFFMDTINGIDISSVGDTAMIDNVDALAQWEVRLPNVQGLWQGTCSGCQTTVQAGGSGFANSAHTTMTMTVSGTTSCTTLPQIDVTTSGGAVTAVNSVLDSGQCADINGPNPVPFSGGAGTGATFNVFAPSNAWLAGTCINIHDAASFTLVKGVSCESVHIGLQLSNVGKVNVVNAVLSAGFSNNAGNVGDPSAIALNLINAVASTSLANIGTSSGTGLAVNLSFSGSSSGAASSVSISNLNVTGLAGAPATNGMVFGPASSGQISNLFYEFVAPAAFTTTGAWAISNVSVLFPGTVPWYTIDAASAPLVSIRSAARIVSQTSGATLTALCNDTIYVNDTTAPTITMPAICPLDQNVRINDIGNNAGAHNITLSMPGGSTIKRGTGTAGSSVVMSTNGDAVTVSYNGVAAYAQ